MYSAARIHRIPMRGHLLRGASHYPYLALAVVVIVVALMIYGNRRR